MAGGGYWASNEYDNVLSFIRILIQNKLTRLAGSRFALRIACTTLESVYLHIVYVLTCFAFWDLYSGFRDTIDVNTYLHPSESIKFNACAHMIHGPLCYIVLPTMFCRHHCYY